MLNYKTVFFTLGVLQIILGISMIIPIIFQTIFNELDSSFPGLDSIGYKQIQAYLKGEMTEHGMEEDIALRTRQFSRRQVKWFRKEKIEFSVDMSHLDRDKVSGIISDIYNCLTVRNQV